MLTDQLDALKARFEQVGVALTNPEIINNQISKLYLHFLIVYSTEPL